jgi:hypothetical protein
MKRPSRFIYNHRAGELEQVHILFSFRVFRVFRGLKCFFQIVAVICWLLCLPAVADTTAENFADNPMFNGWQIYGAADLFHWNSADQNLEVTWDSGRPNSFFYRPLGTVLTKSDDFTFAFDLMFKDIQVGVNPGRPFTFQAAIGFLNLAQATSTNFARGTGINLANGPRNVVEFDYFPDSGFGATISPTIISSNNQFATTFNFPIELTTNDWFRVVLSYTATNQTLATDIRRNGQPFNSIKEVIIDSGFSDFRVDAIAVSSYSDAGADGSILAHATVDDFQIITPGPPLAGFDGAFIKGLWQVQFVTRTNWLYTLERTTNFGSWTTISPRQGGTGTALFLQDAAAPEDRAFYRVKAERP